MFISETKYNPSGTHELHNKSIMRGNMKTM